MPSHDKQSNEDAQKLVEHLSTLFDEIPPLDRQQAEQELRDSGITASSVGAQSQQFVAELIAASPEDETADTVRAVYPRRTHGFAFMGAIAACVLAYVWLGKVPPRANDSIVAGITPRVSNRIPPLIGDREPEAARLSETQKIVIHLDPTVSVEAAEPSPVTAEPEPVTEPVSALMERFAELDTITGENVSEYDDLLSEGVKWAVGHGMKLRVADPITIVAPTAYREATERGSRKVRLGPEGRLEGYIAGLPFPNIDPNEPQAALKIMWNHQHNFVATDDVNALDFEGDTGPLEMEDSRLRTEHHYRIERFGRLFHAGRLGAELPNPDGVRRKESMHPLLEPADLRGVGWLSIDYLDAQRLPDTWLYLPNLRRVRRLSFEQRSDAILGWDVDIDSWFGFNAPLHWFEWRLLAEKTMLVSVHAHNHTVWNIGEGNFAFDDVWEPRRIYVLEAVPKSSQYSYGKRILFVDQQAYIIPIADMYDRSGELWKAWISAFGVVADRGNTTMPMYAAMMVDVQLSHATRFTLPKWSFDRGKPADPEWFTVASLIEDGH